MTGIPMNPVLPNSLGFTYEHEIIHVKVHAEQQHEYSQVLLGFRQLDQLGDREADSEDDCQDQQADHQYVGAVFEDLQTELHLHRIDDQAGPGEIDDDAVDRTVLTPGTIKIKIMIRELSIGHTTISVPPRMMSCFVLVLFQII